MTTSVCVSQIASPKQQQQIVKTSQKYWVPATRGQYRTHIYVHSNFLSCKMSLVFVLLSLLNFRGEMSVYILHSPFFLVFRNFLLQQTNIKIICRLEERLWGPQEDFEHSWFKYSFLPIISIIRTFSYGKYCVSSDVVVNISYAS